MADVGPRARNELPLLATAQVVRAAGMVAFVVLAVRGPGDLIRAAIAPGLAEGIVALLFAARAASADGWPRPRWGARGAAVLSRRSAVAGLARFLRVGLYAADAIALGAAAGSMPEGGAYAASRRVVFALAAVGVVVPTLLSPNLARARSRGLAAASAEVGRGVGLLLGLFVPAALGLILTSGRLLPALFGADYRAGSAAVALVAARLPILLVATWLGSALVAIGREPRGAPGVGRRRGRGHCSPCRLRRWPSGRSASGPRSSVLEAVALVGGLAGRLRRAGVAAGRSSRWRRIVVGCAGLVVGVVATASAPLAMTCVAGAVGYGLGWGVTVLAIDGRRRDSFQWGGHPCPPNNPVSGRAGMPTPLGVGDCP